MKLDKRLTFRVTEAEKLRIEEASQGNVSDFLRDLVLSKMDSRDALELILQRLQGFAPDRANTPTPASSSDPMTHAMLLEVLLVLRAIAPPDRRAEAQAEVRRNGLEPWSYEAQSERGGR